MRKEFLRSCLLVAAAGVSPCGAYTFNYADFSDTSQLTINTVATVATDGSGAQVLRLTESADPGIGRAGTAFITNPVALGPLGSFSTAFSFRISDPAGLDDAEGPGADGIAFVLQTLSPTFRGATGGYLGYAGTDPVLSNSVAIEFDTFFNEYINSGQFVTYSDIRDPDGNHVGVDLNGSVWSVETTPVADRMNSGSVFFAWIDYLGAEQLLQVRLSSSSARPTDALLEYAFDLPSVLGSSTALLGFTAAQAGGVETHDILTWSFTNEQREVAVPNPATLSLFVLGLPVLFVAMNRRSGPGLLDELAR
jgi:hypothetical protein